MPNPFSNEIARFPAGTPEVHRRITIALGRMYDRLRVTIPNFDQGFIDEPLNQGTATAQITVPAPCQFNVAGVDGKYLITITLPQDQNPTTVALLLATTQNNPNALNVPIVHQLQSATDVNFNAASNVTAYGPSAQLSWEIQDPNQTKFWRLQSSFDGQNFNPWQIFQCAAVCGPVGVYSGLLRNSANSINQAATTASGTNPLSQSGVTTRINVASSVWKCGDQTINYNSGSVDPGSFGTWLVYANDAQRTGGTVTFIAVAATNQANITADNGNVYFGQIATSSSGGGVGSGGGGRCCCRAGVPYRMLDGTDRDCSLLRPGDILQGADGGPEVIQRIELHAAQPCFSLKFDAAGKLVARQYLGDFTVYAIEVDRSHTFLAGSAGVIDGASSTHTLQYLGGGFVKVLEIVVGESFSLINGAVGSHNIRKLQ